MNIFWLLKLLDTCPLNESINHLLEQFLALCVNRNRFDEAIELLVKYGWIKGTVSVIEKLLIDPNQTTLVENIIHATKNPQ